MNKFINELWFDLKTANPKTWNLRRAQTAAITSVFCAVVALICFLCGDAKKTLVFCGGTALSGFASLVSFLLYKMERFNKRRKRR